MVGANTDAFEVLLTARGIVDLTSGIQAAHQSFAKFRHDLTPYVAGDFSTIGMGLLAIVTRAQAFHDSALAAIVDDNPWAAYALIRSYAENAAVLLWMLEKPNDLKRLSVLAQESERFAIGRIVNSANKRAPGFGRLYATLSELAHPVASSFSESWRAEAETRVATWSSVPTFKVQENRLWACLWLVELTEIHAHSWPLLYQASVRNPSTSNSEASNDLH